ncbi:hypothetical protein V4F39_25245 [Aquincola sp. MAHUQ-54]|uniref:Lipoprotein n=1 Tax=Aquincola agrisoli TaxID=3119538 RepID=A0AAW9QK88_9BURK
MRARTHRWASPALLALCAALAACTEQPQVAGTHRAHEQAWQGSRQPGFNASGWKASDQAAWEQQIRSRTQGQNEYSRAVGQP